MTITESTRGTASATATSACWAGRNPARFQFAHGLLMSGQPRERVVEQVMCAELDEQEATELVAEAWETGRPERQREGKTDMRLGWSLVGSGLLGVLIAAVAHEHVRGHIIMPALGALVGGLGSIWRGARETAS
ncbi:MAG: hypothetical protein ABL977_00645 [Candidatus Eisenbacteria bacterium]